MDKHEHFMKALKCRECGREYPLTANHVCEFDFGPLEVVYDYERIKQTLTKTAIQSRPKSMWRFREILPIEGDPTVGFGIFLTALWVLGLQDRMQGLLDPATDGHAMLADIEHLPKKIRPAAPSEDFDF